MKIINVLKPLALLYIALILSLLGVSYSCNKEDISPDEAINDTIRPPDHEEDSDYEWDENSVIEIKLNFNQITSSSASVIISGKKATITEAGNYRLSGAITDGQIVVDAADESLIRLLLKNVSVQSNTGPAVLILNAKKTIVYLEENSDNSLADWPSYPPDSDPNAALFSERDMTIFGPGRLSVVGNYRDGITSEDNLLIKSGRITVQTADDGIRGKDNLHIEGGNITVNAGGDGLTSDDEGNESTGNVFIEGGQLKITASGDGISAENQFLASGGIVSILSGGGYKTDTSSLSQKGIKAGKQVILALDSCYIDAADHAVDSDENIEIESGNYQLYTARTGVHSNAFTLMRGGTISIRRCIEGFESNHIRIEDGILRITSIDDGFSATAGYDVDFDDGSLIEITGGYLFFDIINGDGIDSNGDFILSNGTVIIHGPDEEPEVFVDCNDDFIINGGLLVGSGSGSELLDYPDTTSAQNSIVVVFAQQVQSSTLFHLRDEQGNPLITFEPSNDYQSLIFSSPAIADGQIIQLYINGSLSGSLSDGISTDDVYIPGDQLTSFTVNEKIMVLNNVVVDIGELN